ncbi:MAG: 50S ribosomal protein L15 [Chloroflexota bacterium]|nr:50S ribosomal protein L15 [Chloroflexota bacterium]
MQQHELQPAPGSTKSRKRVGRGHGSGSVKTSGRGQKGQKARTGHSKVPVWFEGSPSKTNTIKRSPYKRGVGFSNPNRVVYEVVNLSKLDEWQGDVTPEALLERGFVRSKAKPVKILGDGELARPLTVRVHRITASAKQKITAAGGTFEELNPAEAVEAQA